MKVIMFSPHEQTEKCVVVKYVTFIININKQKNKKNMIKKMIEFKFTEKEADELVYEIALDHETKENFTPEFQASVIEMIRKIREVK